ncbi:MAG TPA: family 43 glycosylhydrolase, partial [Humisphaera sp.]
GGTGLVSFASADVATAATTLAVVTKNGEDPSLFADDDGSLWWVTGGGTVAPLKPDPVQGLAGPAVRLRVPPVGGGKVQTDPSDVVGTHGAHLVKLNGWYHLFAADRPTRDGLGRLAVPGGTHDTYVAVARDVRGPYGPRYLAFPHAGQVTLCRDGDRWWAGYGGDDPAAALRHRPAMFPVDLAATPKPVAAGSAYAAGFIVRPSGGVIFEAGPVARLAAGRLEQAPGSREVLVRDPFVARLPDGSYRLTGTAAPDGVAMWRSDDLLDWKLVGVVWRFPDDPAAWFNATTGRALWAPELHRVGDDYFIPFSAGNVLSNGLLRSTTGRPEGPYEPTRRDAPLAKWIDSSLFRDADGRLYLVWQSGNLAELNADRSALAGPVRPLRTVDGAKVGYEGVQLVRVGGWYVLTAAEWHGDLRAHGTYDMMYAVSRTLAGPYSRARLAVPHGGHGMLFQDRDGRWRATLFGNDRTAPFRKLPGVVPMDVRDTGDDLILRPADADGPAR